MNSGSDHEPGNSNEWERWLVEQGPAFLLFARQQTRCEADAQDLLQEAVVECWSRQADGTPPPREWVFATIRRRAIDAARSNQRRLAREETAGNDLPQLWFDSTPEERERTRLIINAMRSIPEIHREVLSLKIWGELTFDEIGRTLGIPPNTAASRYRYGIGELRRQMKGVLA